MSTDIETQPEIEIDPDKSDVKSDLDILNDETSEDKTETKEDDTETETDEDIKKVLDETKEDDEEDIPDTRIRPSIKTIMEKSPEAAEVFKKFPQLRDAYFREAKFTEIYPTLEEAKEASQKASDFDAFNEFVSSGSSKEIIEVLGKNDPVALKSFTSNFLPTLGKLNPDLFYEATIPVINTVIRNLYRAGEKNSDNNSMGAAKILSHFLHGTYDIPESEVRKDPEIESERRKLEDEKNELRTEQFNKFESSVQDRTRKAFTKLVDQGLDPTNSLSAFVKSKIIDEVIEKIGDQLLSDKQHNQLMIRLWKTANSERYSDKSADRIITAFLSRAKPLISEVRSKIKQEATGSRTKSSNGTSSTTKRETNVGTSSSTKSGKTLDPKTINWRKVSDKDILNS